MMETFNEVAQACSLHTTKAYSTSFASSIRLLHPELRTPIYNIYGMVRFADEIVDTFHEQNKQALLDEFIKETYSAIDRGLSMNPILHSFQETVRKYNIERSLIDAFFHSMQMDLQPLHYNAATYQEYIYGSAEVVGLMCLHVFCEGDKTLYEKLKPSAQSLGAAFQKVNFLRDVKADNEELNRTYFPNVDFRNFTQEHKEEIETDIAHDFQHAHDGIMQLPWKARFGVYVAYKYYLSLFKKIKKAAPHKILESRIRIPNYYKAMIVLRASVKNQLNLI